MATYISNNSLSLYTKTGILQSRPYGSKYKIVTDDVGVMAIIERMPEYKHGFIYKLTEPAKEEKPAEDSPRKVKNAKQAMEWLVKNKGEKRGVYSKEQIRAIAEKHGVEFPNWKS